MSSSSTMPGDRQRTDMQELTILNLHRTPHRYPNGHDGDGDQCCLPFFGSLRAKIASSSTLRRRMFPSTDPTAPSGFSCVRTTRNM